MKNLAGLGFAICAVSAAHAADLPAPYVAPLPIFTWTGAYFGVNAGAAFDFGNRGIIAGVTPANNGVTVGDRPGTVKLDDTGAAVGGQIGYNYQFGAPRGGIVIGLEADADYTDIGTTNTYSGANGYRTDARSGLDYLGTVRGRLGYAFSELMIYGTGGFAYGNVFEKNVLYGPDASTVRFFGSHDSMQTGYTAGGGIELVLPTRSFLNFFHSSAVTVKAEYLYYDLGSSTVLANPVQSSSAGAYTTRYKADGNLARVGLNYKF